MAATEVEMVLNQHPKVEESAVIGVRDKVGNEAIKAFIVLRAGEEATASELSAYCTRRMAKFKIPEVFEFCTDFPRTPAGKIEKKILQKMEGDKK